MPRTLGGRTPRFFTYQLNLVQSDPVLTNNSNWDATWRIASTVAEFLSVPLLDDVSEAN